MPFARLARALSLATAVFAATALPAMAQSTDQWPERPVRIIVPLGAGGPADLVSRYLGQQLSERFKQSFVIENRPGASGIIGTGEAAKAAPDGYTLLAVASPHVNLEILAHNKPYQLMRDFVTVAMCCSTDAVLVVSPKVPAKTVAELIALAKAQPGKLTFASSGPGSNKHLGGELFKLLTGTDILHVAYKGSTGARNDIIGGHVDMMFDEVPSVAPNVLAGQVRALGVTGKTRSKALPDVPTVAETVPGYEHTGWFGIMAPTGTPKPIVDRLNEAIRAIVAKPEVQAYWEKQDTQTMSMTPAESEAFIKADIEKWTKVVKAANIKLE
ncbi:Bug family tripartite tricarboxylate transporter substrate binding protein [Rhodoplanes sp. Z2-YC6860]|uniref:Bug family tripartite tricarboxylate transporter substrate binding protein n=1 Tax=Rhodoplanes sp. Z2-YC6860 TaxID=674703 RepID=UPI00078D7911|nr:tripartite tricarboxylate transporter substrate binding protein [Rhodoplanes sp. Z2-YC6860]AMN44504.1 extracytoplasmic binding receptor [Rhodoplanes sp. Z2-YC6860]